jgi:hypothetical protein
MAALGAGPRRWLIEAHGEAYEGVKLILAVRVKVGEPTHFGAVFIVAGIECSRLKLADPAGTLKANNSHKQFPGAVGNVEPVEDGKFVVGWFRSLVWLHLIENFPELLRDAGANLDTDAAVAIGRG